MTYYPRALWAASPPKSTTPWPDGQPTSVTVHWVGAPLGEKPHYLPNVKSIQTHAFSKGLSDIDYNFLVDMWGNLYEGRGWDVRPGAQHVGNSTSLAVCYLEPDGLRFTAAAKNTILELAQRKPIRAHNSWNNGGQYDTSCPGPNITAWCLNPSDGVEPPPPPSATIEPTREIDNMVWYPVDKFWHVWWVGELGSLQHNYGPSQTENMSTKYLNGLKFRPQDVKAAIRPDTFGTWIDVRAVDSIGRLIVLTFNGAVWGSSATGPV